LKLDEVVANSPEVPSAVKQVVRRVSLGLRTAAPQSGTAPFHLAGLAQSLVDSVMQAEYRAREDSIRERSSEKEFRDRFDLEKELRQAREDEERGVITPFSRRLLGSLAIENLFSHAVNSPNFSNLAVAAFGNAPRADVEQSIEEIREAFIQKKDSERRVLTDPDLLVLITCAAMIADGFEYPNAPNHIYRVRRYTAVFIDEVQDFTEIEVFLMGMSASKQYHQITLSGDLCQRLQGSGSKAYDDLFPAVPRASRNEPIFLNRNFRQRAPLAQLSAGFRYLVQGDNRLESVADGPPVLLHCYTSTTVIEKTILERIASVNAYATRHRGRRAVVRNDHARMLRDVADDGLAAIPDRHVLHGDGRLAIVAIAVERLHLGRKRAGQPAQCAPGTVLPSDVFRVCQVIGTSHRHHVNGHHLRHQHGLDGIPGLDAFHH
jgi:hypothetical protein